MKLRKLMKQFLLLDDWQTHLFAQRQRWNKQSIRGTEPDGGFRMMMETSTVSGPEPHSRFWDECDKSVKAKQPASDILVETSTAGSVGAMFDFHHRTSNRVSFSCEHLVQQVSMIPCFEISDTLNYEKLYIYKKKKKKNSWKMEVFESILPVVNIVQEVSPDIFFLSIFCNCHSSGCWFSQLWRLCPCPTRIIKEESNNWEEQWQRSLFWYLRWHLWWWQVMAGSLTSVPTPLRVYGGFLLCYTSCALTFWVITKCEWHTELQHNTFI